MNRDSLISVSKARKKAALLSVKRRMIFLVDLADVIPRASPLAWPSQLFSYFLVVEARAIFHTSFAERMEPVVAVDENYRSVRHIACKKNPGVWHCQTPGGLRDRSRRTRSCDGI